MSFLMVVECEVDDEDPENTKGNAKFQHLNPSESTAVYPALVDAPLITKSSYLSAKHSAIDYTPFRQL